MIEEMATKLPNGSVKVFHFKERKSSKTKNIQYFQENLPYLWESRKPSFKPNKRVFTTQLNRYLLCVIAIYILGNDNSEVSC